MKILLLTPLLLSVACIQSAPAKEAETASRTDRVLTHDQIGHPYQKNSPLPYRTVSLTFDDGPDIDRADGGNTSVMIAEYLQQQGIRATFFVNGCRIDGIGDGVCFDRPDFPGRIVALGHRVANHTYFHEDLPSLDPSDGGAPGAQAATIHNTQVLLDPHISDGMYFFRAPGDKWGQNPHNGVNACDGSAAVANHLRNDPLLSKMAGPFCFDWDAHDWACAELGGTPAACADSYIYEGEIPYVTNPDAGTVAGPRERGILQLHDASPVAGLAGTTWSYDLVVSLVTKLKARSGTPYVFVPLDAIPGVRGTLSFPSPTNWTTTYLSDADLWNTDIGYHGTVRLGDINGDGRADVCGRGSAGLRCALSNADGSMGAEALWLSLVSDTLGYKPREYSTTFQLADIDNDGKADACIRAAEGYLCFKALTGGFQTSAWAATSFSNANDWNAAEARYGSIRVGDVDGDGYGDICGRDADGKIVCSLFNGATFAAAEEWSSAFTALSWSQPEYATTFQLAKVNNDKFADLCVRGPDGILCALSTGSGFGTPSLWTQMAFDDASGWATSPSRYKSIKLGDVDGDGSADVCGRHSTGIVCAFSTGTSFRNYRYVLNTNFGDAANWSGEEYGATLALGDVNGDSYADVCARAAAGLTCMPATTRLAEFDPVLKVGYCSTVGTACDSGSFYEGRGVVHPEANQPNTLQGTCADGASGDYLSHPSIERVRVTTVDNPVITPRVDRELAVGESVRVEVSAYASAAGEQLEIFRAANASSPTWVSLGTTTLSSAGYAWVTKTYTLPSGTTQAVRAVLRPSTLSGACPGGSTTDVDDLAFHVK
ncbi:VCBS repeat-containing protein [Corallococcus exiguus]|uniref:FG-GAP-like repeat-containing protein n=1 Tax=Corallococcus exiguus TaxID=83462 RepID=UPI001A8E39F1|nr:FG-GAP-like repeat-containing protein [Corallococcus exiguus]MBN8468820.1 VCBS repeat-containing protein [Corallococcus exiguus]